MRVSSQFSANSAILSALFIMLAGNAEVPAVIIFPVEMSFYPEYDPFPPVFSSYATAKAEKSIRSPIVL